MWTTLWLITYALVALGISMYGLHRWSMVWVYLQHYKEETPTPPEPEIWPLVTVQLPVFNERLVAERLVRSVAALDYPHHRLEIQVLDDSTDDTPALLAPVIAELAAEGHDIHHIRRANRQGYKAGALAEGLRQSRGEYVAIFDADFIPKPGMLREIIPHFDLNDRLALVQTRWGHLNRDASLLTRLQALLLDGHFHIEQTARCRSKRFFNFNGTAGVWRKEAIADAGGWQHDTLTEDLDLSYRAQLRGWQFEYLPDLVTPAELPPDMNAFKSQQHRWAKGTAQTCFKLMPTILRSPLPWWVKVEAFFHMTSYGAYLFLAAFILVLQPYLIGMYRPWHLVLAIDLPLFICTYIPALTLYGITIWRAGGNRFRNVCCLPAIFCLGIGLCVNNTKATLEAILGHETPFHRTPKYGAIDHEVGQHSLAWLSFKRLLPFVEAALAVYSGWFIYLAASVGHWSIMPFLIMFFLGFSYVTALSFCPQATVPMQRRKAKAPVAEPEPVTVS